MKIDPVLQILKRSLGTYCGMLLGQHLAKWKVFSDFLQLSKGDIVIDLGGGIGRWCKIIAPLVQEVVLVDAQAREGRFEGVVHEARDELFSFCNIHFVIADICHLPFRSNLFDKALSNQVLEHIRNIDDAFNEVSRVMKGEGFFVASTPSSLGVGLYSYPLTRVLAKLIPRVIAKKFPNVIFGRLLRTGVGGWSGPARVGHVRPGFTLEELRKLGETYNLGLVSYTYNQLRLGSLDQELEDCLPLLDIALRPLASLAYFAEKRIWSNCVGLDLIVKYRRAST